eukprot:91993-Pyramimonas_sp.AAC.1
MPAGRRPTTRGGRGLARSFSDLRAYTAAEWYRRVEVWQGRQRERQVQDEAERSIFTPPAAGF